MCFNSISILRDMKSKIHVNLPMKNLLSRVSMIIVPEIEPNWKHSVCKLSRLRRTVFQFYFNQLLIPVGSIAQ